MPKLFKFFTFFFIAAVLTGCGGMYEDEVLPPTQEDLEKARMMIPSGSLQRGVFHMQRIQTGSAVLVKDQIELKRPDLPPFDVAYMNRDIESILLELANVAGESVVIPNGLRGRTVTLVHSGANFEDMLKLVLNKAGYHYNYVDGIWYVTRYPVRNYILELGQSSRSGSIISQEEIQSSATGNSDGTPLDTEYSDDLWDQVEKTIEELVEVGQSELAASAASATPQNGGGFGGEGVLPDTSDLLPSPSLEDANTVEDILGTITEEGNIRPLDVTPPASSDHLVAEEDAEPWFRVTRSVGLITVRAAPEAHRLIEDYLEQVQETAHRQIVVEARIVAVIQDKKTDRGINLERQGFNVGSSLLGRVGFEAANPVTNATAGGGFLTLSSASNSSDIAFVVQALSTIGDVYTISSPTLLARNNQISRVSITRELGYAETEVEQNTTSTGQIAIGSRVDTARFKNAGTVMSVFPYIGKSKVQMRVRLSVASKVGDTTVRTSIGANDPITNSVPELSNNVIDQDMVLEYGRVYAIGGLIETSADIDHSYIPGLNQVPGLGEIFQRAEGRQADTEFIVLMKVSRS
jgi:type II secretory pathway component GspD/PulD (secretin)